MKSSKRGVPRKRISFSISGVVSLVILLFYLLGAESATGAVKKQVTPNGKRLIDSPYFISKWDKEREESETFPANSGAKEDNVNSASEEDGVKGVSSSHLGCCIHHTWVDLTNEPGGVCFEYATYICECAENPILVFVKFKYGRYSDSVRFTSANDCPPQFNEEGKFTQQWVECGSYFSEAWWVKSNECRYEGPPACLCDEGEGIFCTWTDMFTEVCSLQEKCDC